MKILYVIHRPTWTDSRLADILRTRGASIEYRCPADGDPLLSADAVDGVIIGGGSIPVSEADRHQFLSAEIELARAVVEHDGRYLGLCLGSQILGAAFGRRSVTRADGLTEAGVYPITTTAAGRESLGGLTHVYQLHWQSLESLPDGAELLASSDWFEVQAWQLGSRAYGLQFHPDCRLDSVEGWWIENPEYHDRPGVQPLHEQLQLAEEHEPSIQKWAEDFIDRWLESD